MAIKDKTTRLKNIALVAGVGINNDMADNQSLTLLISLLTSSATDVDPSKSSAIVPPPQYLCLVSTLTLHPLMTTRSKPFLSDRHEASLLALRLLKLTLKTVGPINGGFGSAFEFKHFEGGLNRYGKGARQGMETPGITGSYPGSKTSMTRGDDSDHVPNADGSTANGEIRNEFARNGSLWVRAEDFWACAGWAFNCSVLRSNVNKAENGENMYTKRWERWRTWLEFMLDLMEEDWRLREIKPEPMDKDADVQAADGTTVQVQRLRDSLIFKYITSSTREHGRDRRIMRAIFADGTTKSTNEFREIFKNELKEPKKESSELNKSTVPRVNIEEEVYGDYLGPGYNDEDSDKDEEDTRDQSKDTSGRPKRRRVTREEAQARDSADTITALPQDPPEVPHGSSLLGGTESLFLRLRLLSLLISVSVHISSHHLLTTNPFLDLHGLLDLLTEFIRFSPLSLFACIVNPTISLVAIGGLHNYTSILESILFRLLEPSAPETEEVYLTQSKLETCYLPFAANSSSSVENAKVSLVLEGLVRVMYGEGGKVLRWKGEGLAERVEEGIERREEKVKWKLKGEDDEGWVALVESGERIRDVVDRLMERGGGGGT